MWIVVEDNMQLPNATGIDSWSRNQIPKVKRTKKCMFLCVSRQNREKCSAWVLSCSVFVLKMGSRNPHHNGAPFQISLAAECSLNSLK